MPPHLVIDNPDRPRITHEDIVAAFCVTYDHWRAAELAKDYVAVAGMRLMLDQIRVRAGHLPPVVR